MQNLQGIFLKISDPAGTRTLDPLIKSLLALWPYLMKVALVADCIF
jgi:hypothetical protein